MSHSYTGPSFGSTGAVRAKRREDEKGLVADALAGQLSLERRQRIRDKALAEIPSWYSPYGQLTATIGIGVVALLLGVWELSRLSGIRLTDYLIIPLTFVMANFFEWRVHRDVLHRRRKLFETLYDKHTPMHHMIYVEQDMALRSVQEFRLVLIPAVGVLGIVVLTAPFALAISYLWSACAGWLFLVTASLYMVSYEVLHLCYHAPHDSFIGRRRFIAAMRTHHARHHNPRLMQRWNFNVIFPLADWVLGTIAPKGENPIIDSQEAPQTPQ